MIALIEGHSANAFLVALPDGEYTVWLIACDAERDPPLFEAWANHQKKLDVRIPRAAFVYMEPFRVQATGGRLKIELNGRYGWILNGLVIGKEGPELAQEVAKLTQDIFFLTDRELPNWKEVKDIPVNPPLELTPQEVDQGLRGIPRRLSGTDRANLCSCEGSDWKAVGGLRHAGRVRAGDVMRFRAEGLGKRGGGSIGLCRGRARAHDLGEECGRWGGAVLASARCECMPMVLTIATRSFKTRGRAIHSQRFIGNCAAKGSTIAGVWQRFRRKSSRPGRRAWKPRASGSMLVGHPS